MDGDVIEKTRRGERVLNSDPVFSDVMQFLTEEADLLDQDRYVEWLDLVEPDITYDMPKRHNVYRRDGAGFDIDENGEFVLTGAYYADTYETLKFRVRQNVEAASSWFRDPSPRTHRIVSNLIVSATGVSSEFEARSSIMMTVNRFDQPVCDFVTAKRYDLVRKTSKGLRLAKRLILVDQTLLAQPFGLLFL